MADPEEFKARVDQIVDEHAQDLIAASHSIHANPELGYDEHHAHDVLTKLLAAAGMSVTRGAYGLATAFEATSGTSGPRIAIMCEYDALAGIGHACGHNIIGAAGAGAAIAAGALANELGGTVVALGTPAEEGGGGKVLMAEKGALEHIDAAMMVHPAGVELSRISAIAIQQLEVTYHGKAAHAAAAPHLGRNALDAAVLGYMNVAALRQHILPTERIHGIFTDAGDAANVVPAHAGATWYVRSPTVEGLKALKARVVSCLEAGTEAAGCTMDIRWIQPAFANMVDNDALIELYRDNLARSGRTLLEPASSQEVVGSTDMGNVSHVVASMHPMIAIAPPEVAIHTEAFVRYACSDQGDRAVIDGAKAMAATVVDLWTRPEQLEKVKAGFRDARNRGVATGSAVIGV